MIIVDIATEHAEVQSQLCGRIDMPTPYSVASNHSTVDIILLSWQYRKLLETVKLTSILLFPALSEQNRRHIW